MIWLITLIGMSRRAFRIDESRSVVTGESSRRSMNVNNLALESRSLEIQRIEIFYLDGFL